MLKKQQKKLIQLNYCDDRTDYSSDNIPLDCRFVLFPRCGAKKGNWKYPHACSEDDNL